MFSFSLPNRVTLGVGDGKRLEDGDTGIILGVGDANGLDVPNGIDVPNEGLFLGTSGASVPGVGDGPKMLAAGDTGINLGVGDAGTNRGGPLGTSLGGPSGTNLGGPAGTRECPTCTEPKGP